MRSRPALSASLFAHIVRVAFLGKSSRTALEVLDISGNNFNTTITPNWFWNSTNLTSLNLRGCDFHGPIRLFQMTLAAWPLLNKFHSRGIISCPPWYSSSFKNLCNLKVLDLEQSSTPGDITELMGRLSNCPSSKMQMLDLSYNHVSRALPNSSGPLTNLTYLVLCRNKLTGPIPQWIWQLSDLFILELAGNKLSGMSRNII